MAFMDRFSIKGKKILVTGGAQGIGKTVSECMADCGADIGIFDLQYELASKTAAELHEKYGVRAKAFRCNVTDPDEVDRCMEEFVSYFGTLDGVFNNAGICLHKSAVDATYQE